MVERRSGFRWVLLIGLTLWIGCSDESETPSTGFSDSGGNGTGVTRTVPDAPTPPAEPIKDTTAATAQASSSAELIEAGRSAYNANCTACHSLDPTKDGALGPAVAGSSRSLIEARVLRAEYPEAYEPKRNTRVMIALPHLEPRLAELAAYLGSLD